VEYSSKMAMEYRTPPAGVLHLKASFTAVTESIQCGRIGARLPEKYCSYRGSTALHHDGTLALS
jgi:hypothetical protein